MSFLHYNFQFTPLNLHCLSLCFHHRLHLYVLMYLCISTYTFVDSCIFASMTFSSLASFYIVCYSRKCYSIASFSSDSSMNTNFINVAFGLIYTLAHQLLLLMCKNSTINVPVLYMLCIIICTNCIFSFYIFPSAHSKDDDEFNDDLKTNDWIFNTPSRSTILNSSSTFVPLNNFVSSCYLCVCLVLYIFFSFLFFIVFQSHFLHSCCCELQNFENTYNFQQ
jgi:hypothetical protein